ncbi:hypothetical protein EJB05_34495, partial [Eragrostis curvula]
MAESKEAPGSSKKKEEKKDEKKAELYKPFDFPYNFPVSRSSATTIEKFSASLQRFTKYSLSGTPIAVAIGPYHHDSPQLREMEEVKRAALEEFRRAASQPCEAARGKVLSLVGSARRCYAGGERYMKDDGALAEMMFLDSWFLLQFMVSMCPDDPDAPPEEDLLMARAEVHTRINDIARDLLLLENQIPWFVLEALKDLWPTTVPVDKFLRLMASAFDIGNQDRANNDQTDDDLLAGQANHDHLLGLFYRRQVGPARTQSLRVPRLSSLSSTAVELAEMGVKLTAGKTKEFGDMSVKQRQWRGLGFGLYGELSLSPLVLNDLTACWLINMAAYEECLGATQADNFAVSSYVSVLALLMNRKEDAQELRAKGIVNSGFCDKGTLNFFKGLAPHLHVGHRYYHVFQRLQEYKQERRVWIAIHRFFYKNIKTILAVLSVAGVLAGLFKTILSLKQPQRLAQLLVPMFFPPLELPAKLHILSQDEGGAKCCEDKADWGPHGHEDRALHLHAPNLQVEGYSRHHKSLMKALRDYYAVKDGDQADVEPELPFGEVPLSHRSNDERLHRAEDALRHGHKHVVGVILEQPGLHDDPEGPCDAAEGHEERPRDPFRPAARARGLLLGEGVVVVDRSQRWPGVEGDDHDTGDAQHNAAELGSA